MDIDPSLVWIVLRLGLLSYLLTALTTFRTDPQDKAFQAAIPSIPSSMIKLSPLLVH